MRQIQTGAGEGPEESPSSRNRLSWKTLYNRAVKAVDAGLWGGGRRIGCGRLKALAAGV